MCNCKVFKRLKNSMITHRVRNFCFVKFNFGNGYQRIYQVFKTELSVKKNLEIIQITLFKIIIH